MIMAEVILFITALFVTDNQDFLEEAQEQIKQGAEWEYVGHRSLDPKAKSISMQCVDGAGNPCGEKFILWKLKKREQ